MSGPRRRSRALSTLGAAVGATLVALGGGLALAPLTPAVAAPATGSVTVRVDDVSPSTPVRTNTPTPLSIRVTLTNTGDTALRNVRVLAFRGDPIGNQAALDSSLEDGSVGTDPLPVPASRPLRVNLNDSTPVTTTFATTTTLLDDGSGGLCLCDNKVYPIQLVVRADDGSQLGSTLTYVPSLYKAVRPVQVSWVWPLIDRPHRLVEDTVFTDDALAASVGTGGRLDNALRTIEILGGRVPVTLVVDPELLDELQVMATGTYTVRTGSGTTAGTGQAVAQSWLDRFGALLSNDSAVQVSLTPYADPDVVSLTEQGLPWATELPADMSRRVVAALDGRTPTTDVAWPAAGAVSRRSLNAMAASGVGTVVLDSGSVSPSTANGSPVAVTRLTSDNGPVTGAMTSPAIQAQLASAVEAGSSDAAALPTLAAEIAVRAFGTAQRSSQVVMTPPRYVDAAPERAARVIQDTSSTPFSTPVAVRDLVNVRPGSASRLRADTGEDGLPPSIIRDVTRATLSLPAVDALLVARGADAVALVNGLPRAVQRVTSSAWRTSGEPPFGTATGPGLAQDLTDRIDTVLSGVRIVQPASGSYTLGSDNSSLPITVENTLPYAVEVQVSVAARDRLPGYTAKDVGTTRIAPDTKQTVQVPSRLERSGRIQVDAQLRTSTGNDLGPPVALYVRSTVFGVIGIAITVGAGGVLALALIVRFGRRLQRLRRKAARDHTAPEPRSDAMATAGEAGP